MKRINSTQTAQSLSNVCEYGRKRTSHKFSRRRLPADYGSHLDDWMRDLNLSFRKKSWTQRFRQLLENQIYPLFFHLGDSSTEQLFMDDSIPHHRSSLVRQIHENLCPRICPSIFLRMALPVAWLGPYRDGVENPKRRLPFCDRLVKYFIFNFSMFAVAVCPRSAYPIKANIQLKAEQQSWRQWNSVTVSSKSFHYRISKKIATFWRR